MQQVGKPVSGKDFVGREKELAILMEYIKMGQSVVLVAPRRFGKTSLVLEALNRLSEEGFYTAYIDVFTNPGIDMLSATITQEVLKNHKLNQQFARAKSSAVQMLRNLKLKTVIDDFQFIIGFADQSANEWDLIAESIDFVDAFAQKHDKQMVCAYDEFGDIGKFDRKDDLVKLFRAKIQTHKQSTYIFSGSYESVMQHMFVSNKAPFYRLARIIRLGYLEPDPLTESLEARFSKLGLEIAESYARDIVNLTQGHPYYAQLAFQQCILHNALEGHLPQTGELLAQLLSVEKDYLEKVWEGVSGSRENVLTLKAIADDPNNIYKRLKPKNINIARATRNLEGLGILFKSDQAGYTISDPLLREWIRKTFNSA